MNKKSGSYLVLKEMYLDILTPLAYIKTNGIRIGDVYMFHKGLNREIVVACAKEMEENNDYFNYRSITYRKNSTCSKIT